MVHSQYMWFCFVNLMAPYPLAHLKMLKRRHNNSTGRCIHCSVISVIYQSTFDGAIFHCEDKHASSLRNFCPCLYFQASETTFMDASIFETAHQNPQALVTSLVSSLQTSYGRSYPWAIGKGTNSHRDTFWPKRRKLNKANNPSFHSSNPHFGQCSASWQGWFLNSSQWPAPATSPLKMFTHSSRFFKKLQAMAISSCSTRTWPFFH